MTLTWEQLSVWRHSNADSSLRVKFRRSFMEVVGGREALEDSAKSLDESSHLLGKDHVQIFILPNLPATISIHRSINNKIDSIYGKSIQALQCFVFILGRRIIKQPSINQASCSLHRDSSFQVLCPTPEIGCSSLHPLYAAT
jgi:hypothetical protein